MTAILAVNSAEAKRLIQMLSPSKIRGIYHFSGFLQSKKVALYLTHTGVPALEQVRRFLRLYPFERIICVGTAAALSGNLARFDAVLVDEFISANKNLLRPHKSIPPSKTRIVSVQGLISNDLEKLSIAETYQAQLLDQEFYRLASILSEKEFSAMESVFLKIIDDVAGDGRYLEKEAQYRYFFAAPISLRKFPEFLSKIFNFGVLDYIEVLKRKRTLQMKLFENIKKRLSAKMG